MGVNAFETHLSTSAGSEGLHNYGIRFQFNGLEASKREFSIACGYLCDAYLIIIFSFFSVTKQKKRQMNS